MVDQAVANHQLHVAQHQRLGLALRVGPAQRAAADHELALVEEPVGDRIAFAAEFTADVDPGNEDAPVRITPQLELRTVDQQLLEAQLEREQRARRDRCEHPRQAERGALLGVEHGHVAQLQRRHPATRSHLDVADSHRNPERPAGPLGDRLTPLLDVGQNRPVQGQPGDQQQAARRGEQPENEAQRPPRGGVSCWSSGRLGQQDRGHENIGAPA